MPASQDSPLHHHALEQCSHHCMAHVGTSQHSDDQHCMSSTQTQCTQCCMWAGNMLPTATLTDSRPTHHCLVLGQLLYTGSHCMSLRSAQEVSHCCCMQTLPTLCTLHCSLVGTTIPLPATLDSCPQCHELEH